MCEGESVEYLRDLIYEKENLEKEGEHSSVLKKLITQGKWTQGSYFFYFFLFYYRVAIT